MAQARPIHAKPEGPIQGNAKRGFDAPYAEQEEAGRRELESTLTGRNSPYGVPRDDTAMKNPDGDLSDPSAKPVKRR
jgi:hypothetical protein